ncbi:MAG TPA: LuxR C-terminal-related transcriptional regulator [Galbitalea sp.]|jgi:DNA-binding NarL/FixJ family response regulator|nr:LuxR C-terminal-related transcriptional regulator [Galbitalea sp.]
MDLWSEVGLLWDRAIDGDPAEAALRATALASASSDAAERAILLGSRALCEILLCRYKDATRTAIESVTVAEDAAGPIADDARYYSASVRLVAAAMFDPEVLGDTEVPVTADLPVLAEIQDYARSLSTDRPERLLLVYPTLEASMSSGDFGAVAVLVDGLRPFRAIDSELSARIVPLVMTQFARSAAFQGELDGLARQATEIFTFPGIDGAAQLVMLTEALLCYSAGQRSDRKEVERLSRSVLARAHGLANYIAVGSCLLVTWAFSAIGQVQRAATLLISSAGGPDLPRIKIWDRSFGYELLVTAALRRGDLAGALEWAALAEPLAVVPVAAAAVERTLSRIATAVGQPRDAAERANASALMDTQSGAKLDALRARVLYASALASAGDTDVAVAILAEITTEADRLGATSVRKLAAREWRTLSGGSTIEGGFSSLSDREREIAVLVAEGHTNRSIGSTLFLSERTVQTHLSRILSALGLPSRTAIPAALGVGSTDVEAPPLTARQEEIARLVARGYANALIAQELGISVKTVENHLAGIFARWQVSSRTAVANIYVARSRQTA